VFITIPGWIFAVLIGGVLILSFVLRYDLFGFLVRVTEYLFENGIKDFDFSVLGGIVKIEAHFSEAAIKEQFEKRLEEFKNLFGEIVRINISRYPESNLGIPKYMWLEIFGRETIYELVPIVIRKPGIWFFTPGLKAWDFITTAEDVGRVYPRRGAKEKEAEAYSPVKTGYIGSFQIQQTPDGVEVEPGDVVAIIFSEVDPRLIKQKSVQA
jgi:hypothetical protein